MHWSYCSLALNCRHIRVAEFKNILRMWHITRRPSQGKITDNKVHGAIMGLTWVLSAPDGPHVGPVNLAIRFGTQPYSPVWDPVRRIYLWMSESKLNCRNLTERLGTMILVPLMTARVAYPITSLCPIYLPNIHTAHILLCFVLVRVMYIF